MAALQCEICGGKLMGKAGGIFECDSCGMQYDKTWVKEKVQEIKGTVKVEGTVEVQGTVKVEGPVKVEGGVNKEALLTRGQLALKEGEFVEAQSFFDQVLNADAKCSEAYLGIALTKAKCTDMEAFVKRGIHSATETTCVADVQDLQAEEILIRKYETPPFLTADSMRRQLVFDFTYSSLVQSLEEKYNEAVGFLKNSKELRYAKEYGTARVQQRLQNWMALVNEKFGAAITEAKQQDWQVIQKIEEHYREWLSQKETTFSEQNGQNHVWNDVYKNRDLLDLLHNLITGAKYTEINMGSKGIQFSGKGKRYPNDRQSRFALPDWSDVVSVCDGGNFIVGLKSDGTVVASGDNKYGQCDVSSWTDIVAIAIGNSWTAGLKSDGTVVTTERKSPWADIVKAECVKLPWKNVVAIARSDIHTTWGLLADGTVICNESSPACVWHDIVAIAACGYQLLGLKSDGTVVETRSSDASYRSFYGFIEETSSWNHIVAIAASEKMVAGLKSDGTVVTVEDKKSDQCDVSSWRNIVAIDVTDTTIIGLTADGTIVSTDPKVKNRILFKSLSDVNPLLQDRFSWKEKLKEDIRAKKDKWKSIYADRELLEYMQGLVYTLDVSFPKDYSGNNFFESDYKKEKWCINKDGTLHTSNTFYNSCVSFGKTGNCLVGLKEDGTVVFANSSKMPPSSNILPWRDIIAIVTGYGTVVGLKADGTIVTAEHEKSFAGWTDIVTISGKTHVVGLKADGSVVANGYNEDGRCNVSGWKDIVAVSASSSHTVGLKADGTVVAVGANGSGQCDVSSWSDVVAITAGDFWTAGLKSDGTVVGTKLLALPATSPELFVLAISDKGEFWMSNGMCVKLGREGKVQSTRMMDFDLDNIRLVLEKRRIAREEARVHAVVERKRKELLSEQTVLEEEQSRLWGPFSGKRRKEIEARLAEVQAELKKLEVEQ